MGTTYPADQVFRKQAPTFFREDSVPEWVACLPSQSVFSRDPKEKVRVEFVDGYQTTFPYQNQVVEWFDLCRFT